MRKTLCLFLTMTFCSFLSAQVGINTTTPQVDLHVNGSVQVTKELIVGGDNVSKGDPGLAGQVLVSNGTDTAPAWKTQIDKTYSNLSNGTVIAIDGELYIAQEITAQLSDDYSISGASSGDAKPIGNLNTVIIDNENLYTASSTSNSFKVGADGIYSINMNMQLSTTNGTTPVIGIWEDTKGEWVARVNDNFTAPTNGFQSYTLLTSITMDSSLTYSFRFFNTSTVKIKAISTGFTGSGPISQVSIKRLR